MPEYRLIVEKFALAQVYEQILRVSLHAIIPPVHYTYL